MNELFNLSQVKNTWISYKHSCPHPRSENIHYLYAQMYAQMTLFSPSHLPFPGGRSSQRHHLELPNELHQPDWDPGAELRLPSLHALLPAFHHSAGFRAQPEVPGSPLSGGKHGHDRQLGPCLLLLTNGKHQICLIPLSDL